MTSQDGETWTGPFGTATRITARGPDPAQTATLATWLVHIPSASPAWSDYQVSVVHLRDIPDTREVTRQYPEAAYELMMYALDPDRHPRPDDVETLVPLHPLNMVIQFHGISDEDAGGLAEACARAMCLGILAAEPDFEPQRQLWRDMIRNSIEHIQTGGHARGVHGDA